MPGRYARVFYHNARLTDEQVETLRMGDLPVAPSGGYWALDGSGSTELNTGGAGNRALTNVGTTSVLDMDLNPTT